MSWFHRLCGLTLLLAALFFCVRSEPQRVRADGEPPAFGAQALDPPAPLVKIRVRVPACSGPGRDLIYCILVENCSPAEAHHVVVKDPLPKNAKFVKADPEPAVKDGELRWNIGTLGGGACREIKLVLRPTDLEDVKNCVRVQYEHGECVVTRQLAAFGPAVIGEPPLLEPGKEKPKDKIPPPPDKDKPAKLKVTVDGPAKGYLNRSARYFITVSNEGIGPAGNVLATFKLAAKAEFVKASDKGEHLESQVAWVLGDLPVGAKRTVVVEVKAKEPGELCHEAAARADGGISSGTVSFCTTFAGITALMLEMYDRDDPIPVGGDTAYPILIRNTGTGAATNLQLKAYIGDGLMLTRAKGPADHRLGEKTPKAQELVFEPIVSLEPGKELNFEVFVKGSKAGDARFRIELTADQLREGGPVLETESTQVYAEDPAVSRRVSPPEAYRPSIRERR
ncbi:MAG: hypothetical protein U0793_20260 [Gemmataceae bacterium]